ncbi:hypothetical protein Tco_0141130 [Tanacetum coccineum]
MRDFHKTHPSGSSTVTKTAPSAAKIKPSVTSEGTSGYDEDDSNNKQESSGDDNDQKNDIDDDQTQSDNENESNSKHETDENESGSESDQDENEEDEEEITDKAEGDEDEHMDYTTSQLYDDVDIRLNEPVDSDKGFVQEEGTDAVMTNIQQGNANQEILQVIKDVHVTLSTIPQKTEVLVTSSSHSFDLAAKFLKFSDIPYTDAEIVSC